MLAPNNNRGMTYQIDGNHLNIYQIGHRKTHKLSCLQFLGHPGLHHSKWRRDHATINLQEDKEDDVDWAPKERGLWLADKQGGAGRGKMGYQRKQRRGHEQKAHEFVRSVLTEILRLGDSNHSYYLPLNSCSWPPSVIAKTDEKIKLVSVV